MQWEPERRAERDASESLRSRSQISQADRPGETNGLREGFECERERLEWEHALVRRERELNEASAAVERAARSLESQRRDFEKHFQKQAKAARRRQHQLEKQVQSLEATLQHQKKTVFEFEERIVEGLNEIENAQRRLQQQVPVQDHVLAQETTPTGMSIEPTSTSLSNLDAGSFDDQARTEADQLSYEVCDRLVYRKQTWDWRPWKWVVGLINKQTDGLIK